MKVLQFAATVADPWRLGVFDGTAVLDVRDAAERTGLKAPASLAALIASGDGIARLKELVAKSKNAAKESWRSLEDIEVGPCIAEPEKIICVGLNYRRHAAETNSPVPETPVLFSKFANTIASPTEDVPLYPNAVQYDYEVELGVVIGKTARDVPLDKALDYVFGYCAFNDLSCRDLQMRTPQWLLGKTLDKFLPTGPFLVTADEVGDPQKLALMCRVNGETRQNSSTSDMIFSVAEIVSYASRYMTLKPGDVFSTGTPEGVAMGMKPSPWLRPGDVVDVEIEKLGKLTNRMVEA